MDWETSISPEWEIVDLLGTGAYGNVYKIKKEDVSGTYYAALKVISFPQSESEIESMRNEGKSDKEITDYYKQIANKRMEEFSLMEKLKGNTNIVSYEDHKIIPHENGFGYDILIRMELLVPLKEYLDKVGCNEKIALQIGIDVCNALMICEKEKIIHCDLKPENIFVSKHGDFKIGDFSVSRLIGNTSNTRHAQGTYSYMAPEVYRSKEYNRTIDTYALGIILYRLMNYGRAPFTPLPPNMVTHEEFENANKRRLAGEAFEKPADATPFFSNIIMRACSSDITRRYLSAKNMHDALIKCLKSQLPAEISKLVGIYMKKFAENLSDHVNLGNDEKTEILFGNTNDIISVKEDEIVCNYESMETQKITMDDFFTAAGDLE